MDVPKRRMASGSTSTADSLGSLSSPYKKPRRLVVFFQLSLFLAIQCSFVQLVAADGWLDSPAISPGSIGHGHPHPLLQSDLWPLSGFTQVGDAGAYTPLHEHAYCKASEGVCRSTHGTTFTDDGRKGADVIHSDPLHEQEKHKASLRHAENMPKLAFLQRKDEKRSNRAHLPSKKLEHAIRQAFYAYPVFENNSYKVHVHKRGQKQLIRDLHKAGAFNLDVHESVKDEWNWMQTVAESYLEEGLENSANHQLARSQQVFAPRTYSFAQNILDVSCQDALHLHRRAVARVLSGEVYCLAVRDLDFKKQGRCLDVCLNEFDCPGGPAPQAAKKRLKFDASALKKLTCASSRLQILADNHFCGDSSVLRFTDADPSDWVCLPSIKELKLIPALKCVDECGGLVSCLSPVAPIVLSGGANTAREFLKKAVPLDCSKIHVGRGQTSIGRGCTHATDAGMDKQETETAIRKSTPFFDCCGAGCDERGRGELYSGCQSKTRLGKVCQHWNSQSPHKHNALTDKNHNFCRAPDGAKTIWCFTADPDVRSDYCDPLGSKTQVVNPGETFDVVLEGHFVTSHHELSFFKHVSDDSPTCGVGQRSNDVILQAEENSPVRKVRLEVKKGIISALIWEGVTVADSADGKYALCLCNYIYFLGKERTCSEDAHFNIPAGWLHVKGPQNSSAPFEMQTGKPALITLSGQGFEAADTVSIMRTPSKCDLAVYGFGETMAGLFRGGHDGILLLETALGMGAGIAANLSPTSISKVSHVTQMTLPEFTIYHTGTYDACWKSADGLGSASAGTISVSGVELRQQFYALYVPTSDGSNERPFSIFIAVRGQVDMPSASEVYLATEADASCTGTIVGRPRDVTLFSGSSQHEEKVFLAESINIDKLDGDEGDTAPTLEVCMDMNNEKTLLGYAQVARSLIYPLKVFQDANLGHSEIPHSIYTISIPKFSSIGLHWSTADPSCFLEKDLQQFFAQGDYPKALSFWVDSTAVTVWHSTTSRPAPKALAKFLISDAKAVAVSSTREAVIFYVARENPGRIEKYDMTQPAHLSSLTPLATTHGTVELGKPCELALLTGPVGTLLVTLDSRSKKVVLLDSELNLLESRNTWEGMNRPLEKPKAAYCVETPVKQGQSSGELFDCYITDPGNQRLILVQYNITTHASTFMCEVSSSDVNSQKLTDPQMVVAYPYNGFTLIYVAEAGQTKPMLLTKPDDQNDIRLYQRLASESSGEVDIQAICLLQTGEVSDGLKAVWLVSFHNSYDGPTLHAIPLDTTATTPEFKYTPREWYALGEEQRLEPSVVGAGSYHGLTGFALNSAAQSYSFMERNITIDKKSGVLTLSLHDITESTITVEVIGTGIVNSVRTSFSFRIGCRDGHYHSQGMCVKCQAGTFNSLALVRESPSAYFHSCRPCGPHRTTVAEGSTSQEQCLCEKGYYLNETGGTEECTPCPAGSYKDTVADAACTSGGCPQFSISHVEGATSAEERQCSCLPGYYAVDSGESLQCRAAEVGYFSLGGYLAERVQCPPFTSTNPDNGLATGLTYCLCQPGYAPAKPEFLADPDSPASKLKKWILLNPAYALLADSQVCMLCGRRFYKGKVSAEPCTDCPLNSFSSVDGPTSKNSCNMCVPGYYLTANEDMPCGECQADHFCVGTEPAINSLKAFAGEKISCSENTKTMQPYNKNTHPLSCMCTEGHEFIGVDGNTGKVVCQPAPAGVHKDSLGNVKGVKCPPGSYTLADASTSLADCVCSAGYFLEEKTRVCQPCPVGAYCLGGINPATNWHRSYATCPENTTTKNKMSTSLADCLCDKGFYRTNSGADGITCSQCSINSYKDWTGNEACKQCSENSGTNVTGSTSSAQCLCRPGYYYNSALRECIACKSPFKYCPGGEMDCSKDDIDCVGGKKPIQPLDCPSHTRITEGFDTPSSLEDCKCERGYAFRRIDKQLNTKICEPCNEGSYKLTIQDINCNGLCGVSSTSLAGAQAQVQCFCEEGTYFTGGACHACPDGAICKGGLKDSALEALRKDPSYVSITSEDHIKPYAQPGYYLNKLKDTLESPSDWQFLKCPIANACLESGVCSPTMADYLCSECRYGYTNGFKKDEICTACPNMVPNALLTVGYQLSLLLFNVGMAYMNVAAGFNRRSIHSVVIKIASNFMTCMSVLGVVDYDKIELPTWLTSITNTVSETMTQKEGNTHMMAVECLFREGFSLSFADSLFYTMLFYALLPVLLPFLVTFILYFLVNRFQHYNRNAIKKKLRLLDETEKHGLTNLTEQLREKYEEDRAFMMFRYIPIPGDSRWRRFTKFIEDMIPIYVTVVFFLYTATTRCMLSLLDCTVIDFGSSHGSKYYLRAAMSVECKVDPSSEYFKFFVLGIAGIALWSIGIPLGAFFVLYANRKNLNSREARLKYGFLHNGFVKKYWFWETVVFARKLCVLIISSIFLSGSSNSNGSRLWPASVIAVIFNIYHLRSQPFDKRNYSTLDILENHSMSIWTLTICIMLAIAGSNFPGYVNFGLATTILIATVLFALEVAINLLFAYFDNVRANRSFFGVPVIGYLFRAFARWSEKRKSWEPIVVYDVDNDVIQLIAAKRNIRLKLSKKQSTTKIKSKERQYFLKVMAESLGFAVVHMKLDVIPGTFLEFVLRLGFAFHKMDEDTQENKRSLQAIAGGDISMLADWSRQQNTQLIRKREAVKDVAPLNDSLEGFFKQIEAKIAQDTTDSETDEERIKDIEGGLSGSELEDESSEDEESDENDNPRAGKRVERLISELSGEEQREATYIFDNDVMGSGIPLSELYLALLKLQLKDAMSISQQYEIFKAKKAQYILEAANALRARNRKLKLIRYALQAASEGAADADITSHGFTLDALDSLKETLDDLLRMQNRMKETLHRLKTNPDSYQGEDVELEWVDASEEQEEPDSAWDESSNNSRQSADPSSKSSDPFNESTSSDDNDLGTDLGKSKEIAIIGFDADSWIEDDLEPPLAEG